MQTATATRRLTGAQQRAWSWLPEDGYWRTGLGRLAAGMKSLSLVHKDLAEVEWRDAGHRGGRHLYARRKPGAAI